MSFKLKAHCIYFIAGLSTELSRDLPAVTDFLRDKAAVFGAAIKRTPCRK